MSSTSTSTTTNYDFVWVPETPKPPKPRNPRIQWHVLGAVVSFILIAGIVCYILWRMGTFGPINGSNTNNNNGHFDGTIFRVPLNGQIVYMGIPTTGVFLSGSASGTWGPPSGSLTPSNGFGAVTTWKYQDHDNGSATYAIVWRGIGTNKISPNTLTQAGQSSAVGLSACTWSSGGSSSISQITIGGSQLQLFTIQPIHKLDTQGRPLFYIQNFQTKAMLTPSIPDKDYIAVCQVYYPTQLSPFDLTVTKITTDELDPLVYGWTINRDPTKTY